METGLIFEWKTSCASHHMIKVFKECGIDWYYNHFNSLVADIFGIGIYCKVDYKHINGDLFEIIIAE